MGLKIKDYPDRTVLATDMRPGQIGRIVGCEGPLVVRAVQHGDEPGPILVNLTNGDTWSLTKGQLCTIRVELLLQGTLLEVQ